MVARQPLATVREARYGYAVANMGSNPHTPLISCAKRPITTLKG
jgi:hypothetical protein